MKTMYRVTVWNDKVDEVTVTRSSDKSVWFHCERTKQEVRELRTTNYYVWHETFNQAKASLIKGSKFKLESLNIRLKTESKRLDKLIALSI